MSRPDRWCRSVERRRSVEVVRSPRRGGRVVAARPGGRGRVDSGGVAVPAGPAPRQGVRAARCARGVGLVSTATSSRLAGRRWCGWGGRAAAADAVGCWPGTRWTRCSATRAGGTRSPGSGGPPLRAGAPASTGRTARRGASFTAVAVGVPVLLGVAAPRPPGAGRWPGPCSSPPPPGRCSAARRCAARRRRWPDAASRRPAGGPAPGCPPVRAGPVRARRGGAGPRHGRVGRREHLRRRGRRRCSGARSPACPGCSATGRSTPSTRWSGTGRRATRGSARRRPRARRPANLVPSRLTAALTVVAAPVVGGDRARALADLAARRQRPPQPQRRAVRGGDGRRARRPARRPQRLRRPGRGAARPRRRPRRPASRHPAGRAGCPASVGAAALALARLAVGGGVAAVARARRSIAGAAPARSGVTA